MTIQAELRGSTGIGIAILKNESLKLGEGNSSVGSEEVEDGRRHSSRKIDSCDRQSIHQRRLNLAGFKGVKKENY